MEWITIVDWPGGKVEVFDEEHAKHGDPEGLIARLFAPKTAGR